jgi:hypothetical protein
LSGLAWNQDLPNLSLPSSWDDGHVPLCPNIGWDGSLELIARAGLELWSLWSQLLKQLGLQVWASNTLQVICFFKSQSFAFSPLISFFCRLLFIKSCHTNLIHVKVWNHFQGSIISTYSCLFSYWLCTVVLFLQSGEGSRLIVAFFLTQPDPIYSSARCSLHQLFLISNYIKLGLLVWVVLLAQVVLILFLVLGLKYLEVEQRKAHVLSSFF